MKQFIPTNQSRTAKPLTLVRIFLAVAALLTIAATAIQLNINAAASAPRKAPAAALLSFDVDRTDDDASATACTAAPNDCSLRGAIIAANTNAGPDTINLQTNATYTLSLGPSDSNSGNITPATGDLDITDDLVINGNGSTVDANGVDRIFQIERSPLANFTVTINDLTITGGIAQGNLSSGGGIHVRAATLNLNNCVVTNNQTALEGSPTATRDAGGGIVANGINLPSPIAATVNLTNCTISNNTGLSGGIAALTRAVVTINGSAITGNTATGSGGGLTLSGAASIGSITESTVTGNSAAINGGGISVLSSTLTGSFNRIVGNTAPADSGVTNSGGSVTLENNWWGCNYGPGLTGSGCAAVPNGVSGTVDANPWLVLNLSANPTTINVGQTSALTATMTMNSNSADTSGSGTVPDGIPVGFSGTLGTVAPPSTTTVNGTAGSTFTGMSGGSGGGSATVDGQTVSAPIDVNEAPTITCPGNVVTNADAGLCTAVVNYPAPTTTGVPSPSVSCSPPSGSTFPVGPTTVNCTATNSAGSSNCSFTVTVNETQAPTITFCSTNKTLSTNGGSQVALPNFTGEVAATDNCSSVTITQSPAPGTMIGLGNTTVTFTVKDAANNMATCSIVVTVDKFKLSDFVVFTQEDTRLQSNTKVFTGNVGANTSLPDPNGGADDKEEVEIGTNVKMLQSGSNVVGDTVRLRANSQVYNVHFNESFFGPNATILGNQVTPAGLPVLTLPALPTITPGTQDVTVLANQTLTLAAGSYRTITVNANATLILTGGVYHIATLDIRQNAKLHFTAAAEMRVKNEMDSDAGAFIGPAPSAPSLLASQIVFYVEGVDDGGELTPSAVDIGQNSTIRANFYAPNGTVRLRANTEATGAFLGRRAQIGQNVDLTLKSAF